MKFIFDGYLSSDGTNTIEINFDFMKYSQFINALEPEPDTHILIPEKFSSDSINIFKGLMEKLNEGELEEMEIGILTKGKTKKITDFFKFSKDFYKLIKLPNYYVYGFTVSGYSEMLHYKGERELFGKFYSNDEAIDFIKELLYSCSKDITLTLSGGFTYINEKGHINKYYVKYHG